MYENVQIQFTGKGRALTFGDGGKGGGHDYHHLQPIARHGVPRAVLYKTGGE